MLSGIAVLTFKSHVIDDADITSDSE